MRTALMPLPDTGRAASGAAQTVGACCRTPKYSLDSKFFRGTLSSIRYLRTTVLGVNQLLQSRTGSRECGVR